MEKRIYFTGGTGDTPDWYVSQSPNIMFSKDGREAVVFKDKESLLEAISIVVGFDNPPAETMLIVDVNDEKLGATGEFPDGKLNDDDEGELRLMISKEGDNVRIDFGKPISWLALPKEDALTFANLLIKRAEELKL
jgi:hypothetical protein